MTIFASNLSLINGLNSMALASAAGTSFIESFVRGFAPDPSGSLRVPSVNEIPSLDGLFQPARPLETELLGSGNAGLLYDNARALYDRVREGALTRPEFMPQRRVVEENGLSKRYYWETGDGIHPKIIIEARSDTDPDIPGMNLEISDLPGKRSVQFREPMHRPNNIYYGIFVDAIVESGRGSLSQKISIDRRKGRGVIDTIEYDFLIDLPPLLAGTPDDPSLAELGFFQGAFSVFPRGFAEWYYTLLKAQYGAEEDSFSTRVRYERYGDARHRDETGKTINASFDLVEQVVKEGGLADVTFFREEDDPGEATTLNFDQDFVAIDFSNPTRKGLFPLRKELVTSLFEPLHAFIEARAPQTAAPSGEPHGKSQHVPTKETASVDEPGGPSLRLRLVVDNSGSGPTENSNPYKGMRYYQIIKRLRENGDPQQQIPLINMLVQSLKRGLYPKTPLSKREVSRFFAEITRHQIRLGMIGKAVVADFLRDYNDNEGWTPL